MCKVAGARTVHFPKLPTLNSCLISRFHGEGCTSCAHRACDWFWIILYLSLWKFVIILIISKNILKNMETFLFLYISKLKTFTYVS
jgi:hypothetical protein